jgi:hypothetical protein
MNTLLSAEAYLALKALDCARYIACLAMNHGNPYGASEQFATRWPASPHTSLIQKSLTLQHRTAVSAMTPATSGALLPSELLNSLIAFAQSFSILGRLGAQRVPFNVKVPTVTTGVSGNFWVGSGAPKRVVRGTLGSTMLPALKAAGIIVLTRELLRVATPAAEILLRDLLARAIAQFVDEQFCDPTVAAVYDESPASITNGVAAIPSSGDPTVDIRALVAAFVAGGGRLETAAFILSSTNAVALRLADADAYSELNREGGRLAGVPAVASDACGDNLILCDVARILIADDGEGAVDASGNASIEMRSDPSNQSSDVGSPGTPVPTTVVSMFQVDSLALKVERIVNYEALAGAVQYVSDASYLATGSV